MVIFHSYVKLPEGIHHMYSYVHDISCTGVVNILCICIAMYTKYVYIYTIIIYIHMYTRVYVHNVRLPKNKHYVLEHEVISRWQSSKID